VVFLRFHVLYLLNRRVTRALRKSVLEIGMQSRCELRLHYEQLVTCKELQKCLLCFPTWNIVTCILCMNFVMALHVLLLTNSIRVFPTEEFRLKVYFLIFTRQCMRLVVFQLLLCSLKGRWYERLTHERIFLRWFREVHVRPLVELPLASAYHVCRCGELYRRKI